jgi:RNAse H-fold protein YqgF
MPFRGIFILNFEHNKIRRKLMRILGLDIGDRTIGVAVSDPLGFTAQGITTIRRKSNEKDLEELKKICDEYTVETIVSGLPKNMNGTLGPQSEKVIAFCNLIEENIKLPIKMWDERLTTVAAHRVMLEGDLSRSKRKKIVDKMAAMYILQGYLDSIGTR